MSTKFPEFIFYGSLIFFRIFFFEYEIASNCVTRDHTYKTNAKLFKKLTFLTADKQKQGVRNVSFSGKFAYVLNG